MMDIVAIITTMDNLPLLKVQLPILRQDPLVNRIVVVDQECLDGTAEFLDEQTDIVTVHRKNDGAGPGRNAGIDAAGKFDYALFLDGGMRTLLPGIKPMLDFLERRRDVDVLGLAWHDLETDVSKAWRRWPWPEITDEMTYRYSCLSLTNYCLTNARAWDGLRFSEEGPFGEKGWGGDDDEMAHQWTEAGIVIHAVQGVKAYRRGSGSFRRLYRETGIWPNQYGSTYEKRVVMLKQRWPQYGWGRPTPERTVSIQADGLESTIKEIKAAHERLRQDKIDDPKWSHIWQPYEIIVRCQASDAEFLAWAEPRRLRQHHGDTIIVNDEIIRRTPENEELWTGDFILEVTDG